ncbi:hypothetical protein [Rhizobacter sp. Root1221]|uniref:hypothetical protein n=1 Tax=Rhizobacter sp. Root1221 TaxID=1736433 RepID=UPI0012FAE4DB|nr:hypothetical protein [Rhizobacter sp. Root1221]
MRSPLPSKAQSVLVLLGFALVVAAAILVIRSKSTARLSIEEKVNVSTLANRICKAASLSNCPIEWVGQSKGGGMLVGQPGKPVASVEQIRTVLAAPQWSELPGPSWVFQNGKYSVAVTPSTGAIVIAPF